jgi:RNA polymerase sigma-54 factor
VGVGARNLKECLLIQLRHLEVKDDTVFRIVESHLNQLESRDFELIAKKLSTTTEHVKDAFKVIKNLYPKTGRIYSGEEIQYIVPDVYVFKVGNDYKIVLNEDGLPKMSVSPLYRSVVQSSDCSKQLKEWIQEKMRSAVWLIKSIHQRQRTVYKITESIVKFQREFLDKGIAYLRPMVLRDVADDIQMHESTISRVTTNKYVHTPQGLFELKFFFGSRVKREHEDAVAAEGIKYRIKQLIENEPKEKPLSDQQIAKILRNYNIVVARRTVAKYRDMLNIPSSSKRKRRR